MDDFVAEAPHAFGNGPRGAVVQLHETFSERNGFGGKRVWFGRKKLEDCFSA